MNDYRPQGMGLFPPVVKNLLIINGLFFLATIAIQSAWQIDLNDLLGLKYPNASDFSPVQFFTYMFLHRDFTHLLFNMFALWMFGRLLELTWGPKRFIFYYLFAGVGAALTHYIIYLFQFQPVLEGIDMFLKHPSNDSFISFVQNPELFQVKSETIMNHLSGFIPKYNSIVNSNPQQALSMAVDFMYQYRENFLNAPNIIGASGSVFGLLLAFGMMFPNDKVYVYFIIPLKAKYFVMILAAIELFSGIHGSEADNIAHFAHLGGALFGLLLILWWRYEENRKKNY